MALHFSAVVLRHLLTKTTSWLVKKTETHVKKKNKKEVKQLAM
jgi:hypothetical protein